MTPLLLTTLAYALGLFAGLRWGTGSGVPVAAIAAGILCAARLRSRWIPAAVFLIAGTAIGSVRGHDARTDCLTRIDDGATVIARGVPQTLTTEGVTLAFDATLLQADSIACRGTVVRVRAQPHHIALLDSAVHGRAPPLLVRGRWLAFSARNGWPQPPQYAGMVVLQTAVADTTSHEGASVATRFRAGQQARLRAMLPQTWGLAEALLLAQRAGLTTEVRERWVAAGLVHLLAISGMHVALIIAALIGIGGALGQSRRTSRRAALLVAAAYVLFLGAPAAALRSLLQATLLVAGLELQRPAEPFTALAASALVILVVEPMAVIDAGFQLSFAGMAGLVGWRRPVAAFIPGPKLLRDGLASGIAASALTTPIAALHFGTVGWIGIVATIVATPVMSAAMVAVVLALLLAPLAGASTWLGLPAHLTLWSLDMIAELAARVPGGHGQASPQLVLAVMAGVGVAIVVRRRITPAESLPPPLHAPDIEHARWATRHRMRRLRVGIAVGAGAVVVAWSPLLVQPRDGRLEVHAIDVGQGDALAIRTPRGRWLLVDAGPRTMTRDAGRDRVVPYLLRRGVRRLDALILTHPDADHIGGAAAVLEAFPTSLVIDPGMAAQKDMFADLLNSARHSEQRWVAARADMQFEIDGVTIALLYPPAVLDGASGANDFSVVFRLAYGAFAALFTGDAGTAAEERLVARHGSGLRATLLKVGHHGSTTSTGDAFLAAADPDVALIPVGRGNRYGHPAPSILRRLEQHGVRVLRTDELGNITVRAWRDGRTEVLAAGR